MRAGRIALGALAMLLEPDELVEAVVQGAYQGHQGVCVLTPTRVVLVNDHEWVPDSRVIPLTTDLLVQGWQDDRTASLIFVTGGQSVTISQIADRPLAQDLAHRIRSRVAAIED